MELELSSNHAQHVALRWDHLAFETLYAIPSRNGLYKSAASHGRGCRIVNMGEMFGLDFISDQEMNRIELDQNELTTSTLKDGDLLFGRRSVVEAGAGKCSLVVAPSAPLTFESSIIRVRLNTRQAQPLFYYYFFKSPVGRKGMRNIVSGTNVKGIRGSELRDLPVPIPPLPEQRAIATALSDIDALIASLDKLLEKKRNLKQAAMQQLLTRNKRLPGFSGEWEEKRLGDVIERFLGGGTPSRSNPAYWGGEIPWTTVKDFATFNPSRTQETISLEGLQHSASHLIPKGTLVVSTRMALGRAVIYEVDVAINQDLKALFIRASVNVLFLYYWFAFFAREIDELGSGSTVKGISISDMKNFRFLLTSVSEQAAIANVLSDMDAEIQMLEKRRDKTKLLKKGMMQELLTGKTRLI